MCVGVMRGAFGSFSGAVLLAACGAAEAVLTSEVGIIWERALSRMIIVAF